MDTSDYFQLIINLLVALALILFSMQIIGKKLASKAGFSSGFLRVLAYVGLFILFYSAYGFMISGMLR